jgi:hypothetical protein
LAAVAANGELVPDRRPIAPADRSSGKSLDTAPASPSLASAAAL